MLRFRKYHGLGNDFIIVNRLKGGSTLSADEVKALCDRHTGIGADGVLSILPDPKADARMQVQNADGSESDMCGNGLRCIARYLYDAKIIPETQPKTVLAAGQKYLNCVRQANNQFLIEMGQADWEHADLPATHSDLTVEDGIFSPTCVFLGNPHAVIFLKESEDPLTFAKRYGELIEYHPAFKNRTNVSFVIPTAKGFRAIVHERGAAITQACGSGACAVGLSAVKRSLWPRNQPLTVSLLGGDLEITVLENDFVLMSGAAEFVFEGTF